MKKAKDNHSLWKRLHSADVLDEFCSLMFDQQWRYEDLLDQLEKWGISSSLGALSRFADSHRGEWAIKRAEQLYERTLNDNGVDLTEAQRKIVAERLFSLAASPNISDKALLKMRDQEIKLATVRQNEERLRQNEVRLAQAQETIDMQRRKIEALEAEAAERKRAQEEALQKAKDGGASEETIAIVRAAMGMKDE